MPRRLTIFLFLAVFLASCNMPVSVDRGSVNTTSEAAMTVVEETLFSGAATSTPLQAAADTPTPSPSATESTSTPSTPVPTAASQQAQASSDSVSNFRYVVQPGTPIGITNFLHPEAGCNWLGVGGQAFNSKTEPVTGLIAVVGGALEGKKLEQLAVAGVSTDLGPGGFEIPLGDHPVESQGALWIQLFDANGNSQSDKVFFDTFADCDRALILINFTEVSNFRTANFFPWIGKERLFYYFPIVGQR